MALQLIKARGSWFRGYEKDVGAKTTLRIQNNKYCGYCEDPGELLMPYTQVSVNEKCVPRDGLASCQVAFCKMAFSDAQ